MSLLDAIKKHSTFFLLATAGLLSCSLAKAESYPNNCEWPTGRVRYGSEYGRFSWNLPGNYDSLDFVLTSGSATLVDAQLPGNIRSFEAKNVAQAAGTYEWYVRAYRKNSTEPVKVLHCSYYLDKNDAFYNNNNYLGISTQFHMGNYSSQGSQFATSFDTYSPSFGAKFDGNLHYFHLGASYTTSSLLVKGNNYSTNEARVELSKSFQKIPWQFTPKIFGAKETFPALYSLDTVTVVSTPFNDLKFGGGFEIERLLANDYMVDFGADYATIKIEGDSPLTAPPKNGFTYNIFVGVKTYNLYPLVLELQVNHRYTTYYNLNAPDGNEIGSALNVKMRENALIFNGGYLF